MKLGVHPAILLGGFLWPVSCCVFSGYAQASSSDFSAVITEFFLRRKPLIVVVVEDSELQGRHS